MRLTTTVSALSVGIAISLSSNAYEVGTPRGVYFNVSDSCSANINQDVHNASRVWNRYSPIDLVGIGGTDITVPTQDGVTTIVCADDEFFNNVLEMPNLRGITLFTHEGIGLRSPDVFLNMDRIGPCTIIHELGHVVGLSHSDVPGAIMALPTSCLGYITHDEVAGLADAYNTVADCTPIVLDDGTIYFPNVADSWVLATPTGMLDGDTVLSITGQGVASQPGKGWSCDVQYTGTVVDATMYYQFTTVSVTLEIVPGTNGVDWKLTSFIVNN